MRIFFKFVKLNSSSTKHFFKRKKFKNYFWILWKENIKDSIRNRQLQKLKDNNRKYNRNLVGEVVNKDNKFIILIPNCQTWRALVYIFLKQNKIFCFTYYICVVYCIFFNPVRHSKLCFGGNFFVVNSNNPHQLTM